MTRSTWKGPFYEEYLLKKAEDVRKSGKTNQVIKIWTRKSTILPEFVGLTFGVHNGNKFVPVNINENMVGHKFGEFSPTRTFNSHSAVSKTETKPTSSPPPGTISTASETTSDKPAEKATDNKPKEESKEEKK
jgi:small subunit ribosomal protein S19